MTYEHITIKDICKIKSGKRLPKDTNFADGKTNYPYIRARDIKAGVINGDDLVYLTEDVQKRIQKYIVNTNDIVITIVGASVGDVGYVKAEFDGFNLTENAVRLTDFDERVNSQYLLYVLNSKKYWELMQQIAGGSAQPKLGIYKIESIPLELPSIEIQNRIVEMLKSYDDLIENSQKQIRLLEEAAQHLYKEWFVDLRFPGYENVAFVDGVPEGWNTLQISDVCDTIGGGTPSTKVKEYYQDGDILWVTPTDITKNNSIIVLGTDTKITREGLKNSSAKMVPAETILMTSRASVGFFGICEYEVCTNQGFISCIPYMENMQMYILYNLMNRVDEIRGNAGGSTYLEISKKVFRRFKIVVPDENTLSKFQSIVYTHIQKMRVLAKTIAQLQEARDRLLSKLMSGELEM